MVPRAALLVVLAVLPCSCGCTELPERPKGKKDKAYGGRPLRELLEELKDPDPKVRLKAVKALSSGPRKEAVPGLCQALQDTDPSVAAQAAEGLRWVGPAAAPAVPLLIRRLKDPPSEVFRESAIAALGGIGPKAKAAIPLLIKQLNRDQLPLSPRRAAVLALGRIGPVAKAAVPSLEKALADSGLEADAVAALLRMGKEARKAVPALRKKMRPEKPYWLELVEFLVDIDPRTANAAIPDLRALASSEPVRDKGIVNFRISQGRIARARKLLKKLESEQ